MVGVGRGDINDVDVWVGHELCVGTVGFGAAGSADFFQEGRRAGGGGGGCGCCNDVLHVVDGAGGGVGEEVFCECWGELIGC